MPVGVCKNDFANAKHPDEYWLRSTLFGKKNSAKPDTIDVDNMQVKCVVALNENSTTTTCPETEKQRRLASRICGVVRMAWI